MYTMYLEIFFPMCTMNGDALLIPDSIALKDFIQFYEEQREITQTLDQCE